MTSNDVIVMSSGLFKLGFRQDTFLWEFPGRGNLLRCIMGNVGQHVNPNKESESKFVNVNVFNVSIANLQLIQSELK